VQKALPLVNDGASIILTGSSVWQKGMPIYGTYAPAKATLRSYVRTWTAEFTRRGIRANVISDGAVETPMFSGQYPTKEGADALLANIPLARMGRAEEIASAALFLASKENTYITGIDLPVDGGWCPFRGSRKWQGYQQIHCHNRRIEGIGPDAGMVAHLQTRNVQGQMVRLLHRLRSDLTHPENCRDKLIVGSTVPQWLVTHC
jgi:Enoyl-(Acyl carrier protein) reductase